MKKDKKAPPHIQAIVGTSLCACGLGIMGCQKARHTIIQNLKLRTKCEPQNAVFPKKLN